MKSYLVLLLFIISGCYTQRKATFQITKAQSTYPNIVAEKCALWYPPKIYDSVITEYIKGETEFYFDTIKVDCDSVVERTKSDLSKFVQKSNVVIKYVSVPKFRVDTLYDHQYHTIENTAQVEMLTNLLDSSDYYLRNLNELYKVEKTKRFFWLRLAIILLCYLILKTALRLYFPNNLLLKKLP